MASREVACPDREPYAALADSPGRRKRRSSPSSGSEEQPRVPSELSGEPREHPPGEGPLPEDPAEFVEEIHQRIDLFEIWQELLESKDEKIKQRAVEKLTEMRYKDAQSFAEEPQQVIFDLVRPKLDS